MAQLRECIPFEYKVLTEKTRKNPAILMRVEGKFQHAGMRNANNRVYPTGLWDNILKDESVTNRIVEREMTGELDHPGPSEESSAKRVSHVITKHYKTENGEIHGSLEVLNTPMGQIAATLFEAGVKLGISSRGDGSVVKENDADVVQDDYRLDTYDLVLNPSTPGAYPSVVSESVKAANAKLAHSAIRSLVERTENKDILKECAIVVGSLECSDNSKHEITEQINEKLGLTSIQREGSMSDKRELNEGQSRETVAYIREQVDLGIKEVSVTKQAEVDTLNKKIVEMMSLNQEQAKKLEAAEALIDTFQIKLRELRENKSTDEKMKKQYAAATKLLDEALKRLPALGKTKKRLEVAEQLLTSSLDKHKRTAVNNYVERALSSVPESLKPKFRNLLRECTSPKDVNRKLSELRGLITTLAPKRPVHSKEPLPPSVKAGSRIAEQRKLAPKKSNNSDPIVRGLLERFE